MDVYVILVAIVFLWNVRFMNYHEEYLSKEQVNCIKGMCSIVIVLHHIAQRVTGGVLFPLFTYSGFLFLGMFFFISGYGLMLQYQKRKQEYLKSYWKNRIMKIILPYLLANVVYFSVFAMIGQTYSLKEMLVMVCTGQTMTFLWYIICIVLLYALFWLACKIAKDNTKLLIGIICIGCVCYCIGCILLEIQFVRYVAVGAFVLGICYPYMKEQMERFLNTKYLVKVVFMGVVSGTMAVACRIVPMVGVAAVLGNAAVVIFCCMCLGIFMKCRCNNKVLVYLGNISFEIYLYHGLFALLLPKNQGFLYVLQVFIYSILLADIANRVGKIIFFRKREG